MKADLQTFWAIILASLAVPAPLPAAHSEKEDFALFLLMGQSNMSGRGVIEAQDREPIPGAFKLNSGSRWIAAVDPLNSDGPKKVGVGPGRAFARTILQERPFEKIGLMSAAVGGTTLNQWGPKGRFYKRAVRMLRQGEKSGHLRAILWHQGESDAAGTTDRAKTYAIRWVALMRSLRRDAGCPHVPIIVGKLGDFVRRPQAKIINSQLERLPTLLDNVVVVSSKGLRDTGDGLHFDALSQRELGRRYANAYLSLLDK